MTERFFHWWVSKENKRNSQAEMHRPQPVQRAASTWATWVVMGVWWVSGFIVNHC